MEDQILIGIEKAFAIGKEYSYDKLLEIVKEGELRYRNKIAPGYSDEGGSLK